MLLPSINPALEPGAYKVCNALTISSCFLTFFKNFAAWRSLRPGSICKVKCFAKRTVVILAQHSTNRLVMARFLRLRAQALSADNRP